MERLFIKSSTFVLFILIFFVSCKNDVKRVKESRVEKLPFYKEASFTPHWIDKDELKLKDFHSIPAFKLLNQNGDTITEENLNGKITVADFFFTTCPGICPKMTKNMKRVSKAFEGRSEVLLLSHSVTPEIDSVALLKKYAVAHDINAKQWHLLTGEQSKIYELGRKAYFVEEDMGLVKGADDFLHTENFILLDQHRRIRGIYNGLNKGSIEQLIADIELLASKRNF